MLRFPSHANLFCMVSITIEFVISVDGRASKKFGVISDVPMSVAKTFELCRYLFDLKIKRHSCSCSNTDTVSFGTQLNSFWTMFYNV